MRLPLIVIVALMFLVGTTLLTSARNQSPLLKEQSTGRVRGTVMDLNDAVIPGATIIFESGRNKRSVVSDKSGNYEIELPVGVYQVTANVNLFKPFRRATFHVQPEATIMINIIPTPAVMDEGSPKLYYEAISLPSQLEARLALLMEFMKRRKNKGLIEYRNVTASYDALTIYAAKASFDRKTLRLEAEGNVIVEDGKQRVRVKRAKVEFKTGKPILQLTR